MEQISLFLKQNHTGKILLEKVSSFFESKYEMLLKKIVEDSYQGWQFKKGKYLTLQSESHLIRNINLIREETLNKDKKEIEQELIQNIIDQISKEIQLKELQDTDWKQIHELLLAKLKEKKYL